MESSQLINQKRPSKKQLHLHLEHPNQKYFFGSPDERYQSRCQHFPSVTTPLSGHYPSEYLMNHHLNQPNQHSQHQQPANHCTYEKPKQSPQRFLKTKKVMQSDPNIDACTDYENHHGRDFKSVSVIETKRLRKSSDGECDKDTNGLACQLLVNYRRFSIEFE